MIKFLRINDYLLSLINNFLIDTGDAYTSDKNIIFYLFLDGLYSTPYKYSVILKIFR